MHAESLQKSLATGLLIAGCLYGGPAGAYEWSGFLSAESRVFLNDALDSRQHEENLSLSAEPEFYHAWDNRKQSLTFVSYLRWDQHDDERTHADIRELTWLKASYDWELRLGIRKVFWGVTESQHLVDIINQTDLVENPDGEDKLGQPMINLALIRDWGTVDFFILPGFRERTFPGVEGRLRTGLVIDIDQARYSHPDEKKHIDYAIRWSHTLANWDIGLSHFSGTSREPSLISGTDSNGKPVLVPLYETIDQTSLDLQLVTEEGLWKLEALTRSGMSGGGRYFAAVGGFEYTLVGINETNADLGLVAEYHFDDRNQSSPSPLNNDLMLGARLTLNDVQSTEALLGVIIDLDGRARSVSLEASRRLGASWKFNIEGRFFNRLETDDPLYSLRDDDYLQLELAYYF